MKYFCMVISFIGLFLCIQTHTKRIYFLYCVDIVLKTVPNCHFIFMKHIHPIQLIKNMYFNDLINSNGTN